MQSAAFLAYRAEHNTESYVIVLGTSAIALTYNVVHSIMIQQTSAVTTTVIGQAKIIGLLILSALLLGESRLLASMELSLGIVFKCNIVHAHHIELLITQSFNINTQRLHQVGNMLD